MPLNNIGNPFFQLHIASRFTPQENINNPRASASRVSADLVGVGNAVASSSLEDIVVSFLNNLEGIKGSSCERTENNISVDFPLPAHRANSTLEQVAKKCGVDISKLELHLKKEIKAFSDEMAKAFAFPDREYYPLIETIYNLYVMSKVNEKPPLPWMEKLKDFDSFMDHFCPEASPHSRSYIMCNIKCFSLQNISENLVEKESWYLPESLYGMESKKWEELPAQWVTIPVREEVEKLKQEKIYPFKKRGLNHSTGSAALMGIGKAGAILSAQESLKNNYQIMTGSYVGDINRNNVPTFGGNKGLSHVYTSKRRIMAPATQRWFNEYPVGFCIDEKKQNQFNKQRGIERPEGSFFGGSGIVVGPSVPLENIMAIYAPKDNEKQVKEWIGENCPWVLFVSMEAATVIESDKP